MISVPFLIQVGAWGGPVEPNELTGREVLELLGSEVVSETLCRCLGAPYQALWETAR